MDSKTIKKKYKLFFSNLLLNLILQMDDSRIVALFVILLLVEFCCPMFYIVLSRQPQLYSCNFVMNVFFVVVGERHLA
jgi:hypothetical protein